MVPAEDPELSIIVVIDEPTTSIYGGSAAAPVFADLASFALNRFRIPPAATPMRIDDSTPTVPVAGN
jgi:cell division protein FtsI (penicillin-binding protein 3)